MNEKFLGIPWLFWALAALAIAIVYLFVWPSKRVTASTSTLQYAILRWGHTLVWGLLALAALLRAVNLGIPSKVSLYMALAALALYLVFNITLITSKS